MSTLELQVDTTLKGCASECVSESHTSLPGAMGPFPLYPACLSSAMVAVSSGSVSLTPSTGSRKHG